MTGLPGRLGELRAADIMTPQVITVNEADTLVTAIATLRAAHVTGAPVINTERQLRGIFSIRDLVKSNVASEQTESAASDDQNSRVAADRPCTQAAVETPEIGPGGGDANWRLFDAIPLLGGDFANRFVRDVMTPLVASVPETAKLVDVARVMCDGHWHRVPVVRGTQILCGIISTMDVLAAMVNAADEP